MADMVDCGIHTFTAWAREHQRNTEPFFYRRDLGVFDPSLSADEANKRCDHVGKLTETAQEQFKRGWQRAQDEYLRSIETSSA